LKNLEAQKMIDITYFANKVKLQQPAPPAASASKQSPGRPAPAGGFPVTFRGVVYPWHLDHMDHMNVQHYVGMFDQASWVLLAWLGLDGQYFAENQRGMAALEQTISYKSELRAGDMFEIRSAIVEVREKTIRLRHDMHKVSGDVLAATTTILAVHIKTDARKSVPLPAGLRERASAWTSSENGHREEELLCARVGL
jgi:acyl-CoA thioester hydrolase